MDKDLSGTGMTSHRVVPDAAYYPDIFEYVYFARADSVMDGISVYKCRQRMGWALAQTYLRKLCKQADDVDIVVPVPETSYVTGVELAKALGKPLSLGLVKNRYSSRSFILPNQGQRSKAVRRKISAVEDEMRGKRVLIVDDSIVRGSTSREIVALVKRAGAAKVVFASASPAIRYLLGTVNFTARK
jgi:amidophosphoribosyltransferase